MRAQLALLALATASASAAPRAPYFHPLAKVAADGSTEALRAVGPHAIALRDLACPYDSDPCTGSVLDLTTMSTVSLHPLRAAFEASFGTKEFGDHAIARYDADQHRAGYFLGDWYAEVDTRDASVVRTARVATSTDADEVHLLGTDTVRNELWVWIEHFAGPRNPRDHFRRPKSSSAITLRALDLDTLIARDVAVVPLTSRVQSNSPLEDQRFVHAARDFSRFAIVDYWETPGQRLDPPGELRVVERSGASFAVPVPEVSYGLAFTADAVYAISEATGEVIRVDLAGRNIARSVRGPRSASDLLVTPDGTHLLVASSSRRFVAFDLPSLSGHEYAHDPAVADTFEGPFGHVAVSADGAIIAIPADRDHVHVLAVTSP